MSDIQKLMGGARNAVRCLNVKPGEKVLILTDTDMPREISEALAKASKEVNANVSLKVMKPLEIDGQEPREDTAELMKAPDVLFMVTSKSLTHTKARMEASKAGVRIASMPKITEFSFVEGGLTANYQEVVRLCDLVFGQVKNAKLVKLTSENGTRIKFSVKGRKWLKDTGIFHEKGRFGNLPAGEVFVAPVEGTANGVVVIDKMGEFGDSIKLSVEDGCAIRIEGSKSLTKTVEKLGKLARNIAEFGIGTNPKAKVIGNVLEDEKCFGTCHLALGANKDFGGEVEVPFHKDGIILEPTIQVDDKIIMKEGKFR